MNYYPNYNQFYGQMPQQMPRPQVVDQSQFQYIQPQFKQPTTIQGKSVDSIEVVKATDIPLDGSVSYFPLVDGTAIYTKQLQQDGTSKIITYKQVSDENNDEKIVYVTPEELNKAIESIDLSEIWDLKEDIQELKKQIRDLNKKNKGD